MNDPPVTIDVIKQVKPGCESEFEQALTDLIAATEGFDAWRWESALLPLKAMSDRNRMGASLRRSRRLLMNWEAYTVPKVSVGSSLLLYWQIG